VAPDHPHGIPGRTDLDVLDPLPNDVAIEIAAENLDFREFH
jgi:hypothetical protein